MAEIRERVLVVDDEASIRKLLCQKLSNEGYSCLEAGSAQQASDKLRNNTVSLVILDIAMPGKSGVELLPEIKTSYPDTTVVMATAITDTNIAIQCMRQGAYDYITKPFNLDGIVISVDRALEKRRLELQIKEYQQHLEEKVARQAEKIRTSFLSAIATLSHALEAKDKYTSGHSQRVADIAVAIARMMGLPEEDVEKIRLSGLVHDVGKIGVGESVLNKPSRLTDEEFQHVQKHPEIGEHILAPIAGDEEILRLVRSHHERYNGSGYPDRLRDTQIPLGARILAVADAYEAMTSERPYRPAMPIKEATDEIQRCAGTQFDPVVVTAFFKAVTAGMVGGTGSKLAERCD